MTTFALILSTLVALVSVLGPQLAERIAAGDGAALRAAYDAHAGRVFALAVRIVRSKEEAEDVVQDTFLEVWRRAREYDPKRGELATWILAMARSRCLDRMRRARVRARHAERPEQEPLGESPDEQAATSEYGEQVRGVLAALPAEQRVALELAYFEGLTQQEIAERTHAPLGTVKTRLRLALEKLSGQLAGLR